MFSITSARYFLYRQSTDMRKSFDGLCGLITSELGQNPMSGDLFIFLNKPRNRIKMLRWEPGGFVLFYKRLEKGTFLRPEPLQSLPLNTASKGQIDYPELVMMVSGISIEKARKRTRFYQQ
jgi:transposase